MLPPSPSFTWRSRLFLVKEAPSMSLEPPIPRTRVHRVIDYTIWSQLCDRQNFTMRYLLVFALSLSPSLRIHPCISFALSLLRPALALCYQPLSASVLLSPLFPLSFSSSSSSSFLLLSVYLQKVITVQSPKYINRSPSILRKTQNRAKL